MSSLRVIFNWVSKVLRVCIGFYFTLLCNLSTGEDVSSNWKIKKLGKHICLFSKLIELGKKNHRLLGQRNHFFFDRPSRRIIDFLFCKLLRSILYCFETNSASNVWFYIRTLDSWVLCRQTYDCPKWDSVLKFLVSCTVWQNCRTNLWGIM